jgi:putative ABC transport system permease protein
MLGIIIGVGSVIAMIAIGNGSRDAIQKQIAGMGTNVIMINSGAGFRGGVATAAGTAISLKMDDVQAIRSQCPAVKYLSPVARAGGQVIAGNNNWNTSVNGVYPEYMDIRNLQLQAGTVFSETDERRAAKVCIVGKTVSDNLFGEDADPIGQKIRIRNIPFTIVGWLKPKGQSGMGDQDDIIFAPYSTIQKRMRGSSTDVQQIYVSAISEDDVPVAQAQIDSLLRARKNLSASEDPPYFIRTQTEITETLTSTSDTMTALLASIASISLLVGGIGIMNIMFVSVTERTREIGLRMAIGARGKDIMRQFLLEAVLLSILGGIIGVAIGVGASEALAQFKGWPVMITSYSIFLAFSFAMIIGVFFGWYPARKAANLVPMEALRFE